MLEKDLKIKIQLIQKLKENNILNEKQVLNISYEQGKKLKLTQAEDQMLSEICKYIADNRKIDLEFFTKNNRKEEIDGK